MAIPTITVWVDDDERYPDHYLSTDWTYGGEEIEVTVEFYERWKAAVSEYNSVQAELSEKRGWT